MTKDKRKSRRRPIRYVAWATSDSGERQSCLLSDMSETGARIDVENAGQVPEQFMLLLSANGAARRACRVVWRTSNQIGVRFELAAGAGQNASLVPGAAGVIEAPASAQAAASR
ncbi:MAG TPA: PilZ domain-containing protein [Pseudolabrys sp.]|nr:PilZ domain-containing protein [Pseudolabrys sp.]